MESNKPPTLALDLIGISSTYQGGATVFAHSLLAKFLNHSDLSIDVYVKKSEKEFYERHFSKESISRFIFVTPRNNLALRIMYRTFTKYLRNSHMLSRIQKYRWSAAIESIGQRSYACLTLSTYISFPLNGLTHICTLHDIQEKALPQFFTKNEKRIREVNVRNTLRNVTGLQTSSNFVRNEIRNYYKDQSKKIKFQVISEGFNSDELKSGITWEKDTSDGIKIIFPANYWPHKDHVTFFSALAELNKRYKISVFSTGSLMNREVEIHRVLNELKISNVKLLGYVSRQELIELYATSHIVISCSMYESSSLPLIEGAVLNCVLVGSDIKPHQEMSSLLEVDLFETGNAKDLENKLGKVIERIYESKGAECNRNKNKIGIFEWDALLPEYLRFLNEQDVKGRIE